jgi:hypothetical protein
MHSTNLQSRLLSLSVNYCCCGAILQAALARSTELDPSVPTIAFLITDDEPHTGLGNTNARISPTAKHELQHLVTRYQLSDTDARDLFKTFHRTGLAHFGNNLILNCVVYNTRGHNASTPCGTQLLLGGPADGWYAHAAQQP